MTQNATGICDDVVGCSIRTIGVPEPISQPQHREIQSSKGVGINFLFERMIFDPTGVKCRRAAETLNCLETGCGVNSEARSRIGRGLELPPIHIEQIARSASELQIKIMNAGSATDVAGNGRPTLPSASR